MKIIKIIIIFFLFINLNCSREGLIILFDDQELRTNLTGIVTIDVNPAIDSVASGLTLQYSAIATYSDSSKADVTALATWASSITGVATISNTAGTEGCATASTPGATNITATIGAISGSANLTVTDVNACGAAGDLINFTTAGGPVFNMVCVPGALQFKQGIDNAGNVVAGTVPTIAAVKNACLIAESEVTYGLWYEVRTWATTDVGGGVRADGGELYTFDSLGQEGSDGTYGGPPTIAQNEPVTFINWADIIVWCNALTEYYNAKNGTSLGLVYYSDSAYSNPVRSTVPAVFLDPYMNQNAKGFRLPTTTEWGAASRWEGSSAISADAYEYPASSGNWWTSGDYASGDVTDYTVNPGPYAWYNSNSGSTTHDVNGKLPNALGIYDMSGNVMEWNYNLQPGLRKEITRVGSFNSSSLGLQVGRWLATFGLRDLSWNVGFRIAKNGY